MFVPDPVISMSIKPAKNEQIENFSKGKKGCDGRKPVFGFLTRSDINWPVQLKKVQVGNGQEMTQSERNFH